MKNLPLLILILLAFSASAQHTVCNHPHHKNLLFDDPGNARSDTLDILHTYIYLDLTQTNATQIAGACTQEMESKMNDVSVIHFDLAALQVDSVIIDDVQATYYQDGDHLYIQLENPLMLGDLIAPVIYYHGQPEVDPSFGGFYTNSNYAYNLGVGFNADPHNYGRVWFPCFDNFVERSTYTVDVLTNNGKTAYCGGMQTSEQEVGMDSLLTRWELNLSIPSYLASVAASTYTHVEWEFENQQGDLIPIYLAARAADTTAFKLSMSTLIPWLHSQEEHYGDYVWPRVGYVAVPFSGGAMEHATNIAYPLFAINGNLDYETLMAHELSHHWWGDLVTCSTAEDMWLNEGWASFSEALYMETQYDYQAYIDYVNANHKDVLLHAHEYDGGRYPVSGVPHELTYGSHVYNKGALVAHSLRGYMGDEAFFEACRDFLAAHAFTAISSEDLRDFFQGYTEADLTSFFEDWVFTEGDAEFRIRHWNQTDNHIAISVEQFQHYNPELYSNVPIEISVTDWADHWFDTTLVMTGNITFHEFDLPENFDAVSVLLNYHHKLSLAALSETRVITGTGQTSLNYPNIQLFINDMAGLDQITFHCENHYATANEPAFVPFTDYFLSNDRWWLIDGELGNAALDIFFPYYGSSTSTNYYDIEFFAELAQLGFTENDLKIFYRPDGLSEWTLWEDFSVSTQGSPTNYAGRIRANNIQKGQYCWGVQTGNVSVLENELNPGSVAVFSQPGKRIVVENPYKNGYLQLYAMSGELVGNYSLTSGRNIIDVNSMSAGTYLVVFSSKEEKKSFHISVH